MKVRHVIAASLLILTLTAPAAAEDDYAGVQTWSVMPAGEDGADGRGRLEYVVEPGDVYGDHVEVRNFGTAPLTVRLYAQDARQSDANPFEVGAEEDAVSGAAAWIRLAEEEVTVEPRSSRVVAFSFEIGRDVEPGDYAAGIMAAGVAPPDAQDVPKVEYRTGVRVHVRVAGPVHPALGFEGLSAGYDASWSPVEPGGLHVSAVVVNRGNVRVTPTLSVHARSWFGLWQGRTSVPVTGELLRDGRSAIDVVLEGVPAVGPLQVTIRTDSVTSAGQDVTGLLHASSLGATTVWAVSWVTVVAAALLVLALVLAVVNLRTRLRLRSGRSNERGAHEGHDKR